MTVDVEGIAVDKLKDGFVCPLEGTGEGTASLAGNAIYEAFSGFEQVGLTWNE